MKLILSFSEKIRFDFSCESSAMIHKLSQADFLADDSREMSNIIFSEK